MGKQIEHIATVAAIIGNRIDVVVEAQSACASCKVKGVCGMSESKQKEVVVTVDHPEAYAVGERVMVSVSTVMGVRAVWLAYIVPLILLMSTLVVALQAGMAEPAAGGLSLAVAVVWYVGLWLFRGRLEREILFKLRKL